MSPAPRVRHDGIEPLRAVDDDGVPYQVALAAQDLLDAILGDDYFTLAEVTDQLARLARFTCDGHGRDRTPWTPERVIARVRELDELYNPIVELGGDPRDDIELAPA